MLLRKPGRNQWRSILKAQYQGNNNGEQQGMRTENKWGYMLLKKLGSIQWCSILKGQYQGNSIGEQQGNTWKYMLLRKL
jgi:hypothetical protein